MVYTLELSARTQSYIPHLVGVSCRNCRIPDRWLLDFTMRSSIATFWLGWYNILHLSLKLFKKDSTFLNLFPGTSVVGSATCNQAIRDLNRILDIMPRAQRPWKRVLALQYCQVNTCIYSHKTKINQGCNEFSDFMWGDFFPTTVWFSIRAMGPPC